MEKPVFDVTQVVSGMIKGILPAARVQFVKNPSIKKNWFFFDALDEESYYAVVRKAYPYITDTCKDWLTDFGRWTKPKNFPIRGSIEISDLFSGDEVVKYLATEVGGITQQSAEHQ